MSTPVRSTEKDPPTHMARFGATARFPAGADPDACRHPTKGLAKERIRKLRSLLLKEPEGRARGSPEQGVLSESSLAGMFRPIDPGLMRFSDVAREAGRSLTDPTLGELLVGRVPVLLQTKEAVQCRDVEELSNV